MLRLPQRANAANPSSPAAPSLAVQFGDDDRCVLSIGGTVSLGPDTGQSFQGSLSFSIGDDGAIDSGTLEFDDGAVDPVSGQVTGCSIRLRAGSDPSSVLTLIGSGVLPVDQCTGEFSGAFSGPGMQNIGIWTATGISGA